MIIGESGDFRPLAVLGDSDREVFSFSAVEAALITRGEDRMKMTKASLTAFRVQEQ